MYRGQRLHASHATFYMVFTISSHTYFFSRNCQPFCSCHFSRFGSQPRFTEDSLFLSLTFNNHLLSP
nr:MAG TPA: hypothetical protein [Bacteriophage sp.]DAV16002.1 MAG TPA: hypothetical protein [Caudoviricetes sp.]